MGSPSGSKDPPSTSSGNISTIQLGPTTAFKVFRHTATGAAFDTAQTPSGSFTITEVVQKLLLPLPSSATSVKLKGVPTSSQSTSTVGPVSKLRLSIQLSLLPPSMSAGKIVVVPPGPMLTNRLLIHTAVGLVLSSTVIELKQELLSKPSLTVKFTL